VAATWQKREPFWRAVEVVREMLSPRPAAMEPSCRFLSGGGVDGPRRCQGRRGWEARAGGGRWRRVA
jgi:hypothetical protein